MRSVFCYKSAHANFFHLRMQKHAKNRPKLNPNPKWWKNYPLSILANTFHGCHFKTSNQIEIGAIDHIFQSYLVRSAEVATIKSVWKNWQNFQKKMIFFLVSLSCFLVKNMKTIILQVIISHFINILYLRMTPVPPKTLVSTVQVKFCRAQIRGLPALILYLNLKLPRRIYCS